NIGKNTCVVYWAGYLYRTADGYTFLNEAEGDASNFTAVSFNPYLLTFELAEQIYAATHIVVIGTITTYNDKPQIVIESLNQITMPKPLSCGDDTLAKAYCSNAYTR